jgi:hypothetical protein
MIAHMRMGAVSGQPDTAPVRIRARTAGDTQVRRSLRTDD